MPIPDVNQIELHPWTQKPELISYLNDNGIIPIAYSSLAPLAEWRSKEGQESAKTNEMISKGADTNSPFKSLAKNTMLQKLKYSLDGEFKRVIRYYPKVLIKKGSG